MAMLALLVQETSLPRQKGPFNPRPEMLRILDALGNGVALDMHILEIRLALVRLHRPQPLRIGIVLEDTVHQRAVFLLPTFVHHGLPVGDRGGRSSRVVVELGDDDPGVLLVGDGRAAEMEAVGRVAERPEGRGRGAGIGADPGGHGCYGGEGHVLVEGGLVGISGVSQELES